MGELDLAALPVVLPQSNPGLHEQRVVLDSTRETELGLRAVVGENIESTATQSQVEGLGQLVW